jgi:hypothetical protein
MFAVIRRRLCYANVVATLALVFAMSGGALAAGHYLLTSTSQVSPKVLKALKGREGKTGPAGTVGAQGPQGAKGDTGAAGAQGAKGETGATGATGATGTTGARGATGTAGATGAAGSPWTAGGTLPSGQSETGTWASSGPEGSFPVTTALASFSIPLAEPPAFNLIGEGEGEGEPKEHLPAGCKGNWDTPQASPGNLCVFEAYAVDMTISVQAAKTTGAIATVKRPSTEEPFRAVGSWAVTAK